MGIVSGDCGIIPRHLVERPLPQVLRIIEHVGLAAQGELVVLPTFLTKVKSVADAALHALAGVDALLDGDFIRLPFLQEAAGADVKTLGILAHHDEIDVFRPLVLDRRFHPGEEFHRPQVDVLVQLEARLQQDALLKDAGFHIGMTDGAQEDGVVTLKLIERRVRQCLAGLQVTLATKVVVGSFVFKTKPRRRGREHLEPFPHHFRSGAVAGHDSYVMHSLLRRRRSFTCNP